VGNRVVVCVANTSDKESRQVTLTLPLGAKGAARPMFDGRPSGMTANAGKLSGEVKPLDVHVYEFGG
jgi:hypothetical protein